MLQHIRDLLTALGEVADEVQQRRGRRQDWRTEDWFERFDSRQWAHVTGEVPEIQPQA